MKSDTDAVALRGGAAMEVGSQAAARPKQVREDSIFEHVRFSRT